VDWASDVSTFVKSIDHHHLVSVGDEGFFCNDPTSTDFTLNCSQGVDTVAFAKLEHIDVMSLHLYPDSWGKTPAWGTTWIRAHMQSAQAVGKAVMLGEFGLLDKNTRNPVYREWIDTVLKNRGNGALYWILSDVQDDGTLYPDYDGYTVYCPSPVCSTFSNFSWEMRIGLALYFAPVADNDSVVTQFNTPVTIVPLANDTAYPPATLAAGSIDLDAATPGQQTSVTVAAGTFAVQSNDSVLFTPAVGYSGPATAQYTAQDSFGRRTNVANINVTVLPAPTGGSQSTSG